MSNTSSTSFEGSPYGPPSSSSNKHKLKFNRELFIRLYILCKPYWTRPGAWKSWLVVGLLLVHIWVSAKFAYWFSYSSRDMANALVGKNVDGYWALFYQQLAFAIGMALVFWPTDWLSERLQLHWRAWMSRDMMDRYLQNRTYYDINGSNFVDNPDQRIQSEVAPFCETMVGFPSRLLAAVSRLGVQATIVWSISGTLFYITIVLSIAQTYLVYRLAQPTIKQYFDVTKTEADFRYGLVYLRENAESVAFYQGEDREKQGLFARLAEVVRTTIIKMNYALWVRLVDVFTAMSWDKITILVLVPLFFAGQIDYGSVGQAQAAALQINSAFVVFMGFIPLMAGLAPHVVRLAEMNEASAAAQTRTEGLDRIELRYGRGGSLQVQHLSLSTPLGERQLVRDLSLALPAAGRMIITGPSGVGKSSLLRALAGLWIRGSGRIETVEQGSIMFLPQKPYMPLGNLREQLAYPGPDAAHTDKEYQGMLERVELADLAERFGGFDAELDWSKALSLGEQQRLAFARVMLKEPKMVVLDEATSALDTPTEEKLYAMLSRTDTTVISVAHRESLRKHHQIELRLAPEGGWSLVPIEV